MALVKAAELELHRDLVLRAARGIRREATEVVARRDDDAGPAKDLTSIARIEAFVDSMQAELDRFSAIALDLLNSESLAVTRMPVDAAFTDVEVPAEEDTATTTSSGFKKRLQGVWRQLQADVLSAKLEADSALGICYRARTAAASAYVAAELATLRGEAEAAATARGLHDNPAVAVIGVPEYSIPGARGGERSTTARSSVDLAALKRKLAGMELTEAVVPRADADTTQAAATLAAIPTRTIISELGVELQHTYRPPHSPVRLRGAELDHFEGVSSGTVSDRAVDEGVRNAEPAVVPAIEAASRNPMEPKPRGLPSVLDESPLTQAAIAATVRDMERANSAQDYRGYQRELARVTAKLELVAGITFAILPETVYDLGERGSAAALSTSSVLPVTMSDGGSERLDRKPRWWLEAGFGDPDFFEGRRPRLVPPTIHRISGARRVDSLPPLQVQHTPFTVRQYLALRRDRRFQIPSVPDAFLVPHWHRRIIAHGAIEAVDIAPINTQSPAFLLGDRRDELSALSYSDLVSNSAKVESDDSCGSDVLDEPLCVPFPLAQDIATSLGCELVPFDAWEACLRGVDSLAHPCTTSDIEALRCEVRSWTVKVEEGRRTVSGRSTATTRAALRRLDRRVQTPTGHRRFFTPLGEWTSLAFTNERERAERDLSDAALRCLVDYDTQDVPGAQRESKVGFVGMSASSFARPNNGHVTAAFRLCLPCTELAAKALNAAVRLERHISGRQLSFMDVGRSFGAGESACYAALAPLRATAVSTDPLYGDRVHEFHMGGVDVSFQRDFPGVVRQVTLYASRTYAPPIAAAQRRAFELEIALEGLPVFRLDDPASTRTFVEYASAQLPRARDGAEQRIDGPPVLERRDSTVLVVAASIEAASTIAVDVPQRLRLRLTLNWRGDYPDRLDVTCLGIRTVLGGAALQSSAAVATLP
jgi:hypothetical protein